MKLFFLALCAAAVGSAGTITSGTLNIGGSCPPTLCGFEHATLSGDHYTATVNTDVDVLLSFSCGTLPCLAPSGGFVWIGDGPASGIVYDGVTYGRVAGALPLPGVPFSTSLISVGIVGPPQIVTGSGTYFLTLAISLTFSIYDASHHLVLQETDTGSANATITYNGSFAGPILGDIVAPEALAAPEPAGWSLALIGLASLAARRWLPVPRF